MKEQDFREFCSKTLDMLDSMNVRYHDEDFISICKFLVAENKSGDYTREARVIFRFASDNIPSNGTAKL